MAINRNLLMNKKIYNIINFLININAITKQFAIRKDTIKDTLVNYIKKI